MVAFLGLQKEEKAETRELLLDVLRLFRTGEVNNVARKAADMLESLLRMEPELKTPRTSIKRLRGQDEDPREADAQDRALASVVKRIVVRTTFETPNVRPGSVLTWERPFFIRRLAVQRPPQPSPPPFPPQPAPSQATSSAPSSACLTQTPHPSALVVPSD